MQWQESRATTAADHEKSAATACLHIRWAAGATADREKASRHGPLSLRGPKHPLRPPERAWEGGQDGVFDPGREREPQRGPKCPPRPPKRAGNRGRGEVFGPAVHRESSRGSSWPPHPRKRRSSRGRGSLFGPARKNRHPKDQNPAVPHSTVGLKGAWIPRSPAVGREDRKPPHAPSYKFVNPLVYFGNTWYY